MSNLFQERYRDLPIFQRIRQLVDDYDVRDWSEDEFATRLLMVAENGLNWDTLCMNCGELMDHNYAFAMQNAQLKEDLAFLRQRVEELTEDLRCAEATFDNNRAE